MAYVLLGSARGEREQLEALHGSRLEMLLCRLIDTTVRGFAYETRGSVPAEILASGADRVRDVCERSRLPYALLDARATAPSRVAGGRSGRRRALGILK